MSIFLLIVSIIFNFVNLFIILIIWKKYSLSDLTAIEKAKNEIEDLLIAYTAEMKDDNERLMKLVGIGNSDSEEEHISIKKEEEPKLEYNINTLIDDEIPLEKIEIPSSKIKAPVISQEQQVNFVRERAIALSNQGFTLEEIAKQLNKGKGEIELLLKFHKE